MPKDLDDPEPRAAVDPALERWSLRSVLEVIKVSRPGFYATHLWFFLLPLSQVHLLDSPAFWLGCTYVCFPMGLLLYGWNDLGDSSTDALNPRKDSWLFGARPNAWIRARLPWVIAAVQLPFLVGFYWVVGPKILLWALGMLLANALYNWPRWGTKNWPLADLLNQVGYLLVFVLASWLCAVPQLNAPALVFAALFAMQSHLFGQLMDRTEDAEAGRRSTAVVLGSRPAKLLLAGLMLAMAGIALTSFQGWYVGLFMSAGALFFLVDALFGPPRYPLGFLKLFFVGWNLVVLATMHLVWRYGVFLLAG